MSDQQPYCTNCGEGLHGAKFCTRCGAATEILSPALDHDHGDSNNGGVATLVEPTTAILSPPVTEVRSAPAPPAEPPQTHRSAGQGKSDRGTVIVLVVVAVLIVIALGVSLYIGGVFGGSQGSSAPIQRVSSAGSRPAPAPAHSVTPAQPSRPVTPTPTPTPTPAAPQHAAAPAPAPAAPSTPGPAAVIQNHLNDLNSGDYQGAFRLMTASYRSQNPSWPSDRATADPGITIISIGTAQSGSGSARVPVDFYARDRQPSPGSDTQCREFRGTAELLSEGGSWRYDPAGSSLTSTVMPLSDPSCPS